MAMTPEIQARLLAATRDAAVAFLEDVAHLRDILNRQDQVRGSLRRLSNELRRLLVDNGGDLPDIAAPRIGRLMFVARDNNPLYKSDRDHPFAYCASGSGSAHGLGLFFGQSVRGMVIDLGYNGR